MKINKKIALLVLIIGSFLHNNAIEWDMEEDFLDDFGLEIENLEHLPTRVIDSPAAMTILMSNNVKAPLLLKNPFYFYTHPFQRRNIVDDLIFNFPSYQINEMVSCIPFYNETSQVQYVRDRNGIKEYIDMEQRNILNTIDVADYPDINIPEMLHLFENIKIQERRLGVMFQYSCILENTWNFSFHVPCLYQEHNYFLNSSERKAIENNSFISSLEGDAWDFITNYLLSDKFGCGDLRASLEKTIKKTFSYELNIGVDITLPTAFAVKKGVVGSYFNKRSQTPSLDIINDFLDPFVEDNQTLANANGEALALNILKRANSILLDYHLGNNRHLEIGLFYRSTMIFSPTVQLTSKALFNIVLPGSERRFILKKQSNAELNAIYNRHFDNDDDGDPDINVAAAPADVQRIQEIFIEKYFPESYDVTVFPGIELSSSSKLTYERKKYTWYVGSEMWYRSKERFLTVHSRAYSLDDLEIAKAKKEYAYQTKTWFGFDKNKTENTVWQWGSRISFSGINDGIGDDFTLTLHFLKEF